MHQDGDPNLKQAQGLSRRDFIFSASVATATLAAREPGAAAPPNSFQGALCFFSKHLPDMEPRRLAESVKGIGFTGIDLTVRKRGHVPPEKAAEDLPKAVGAIRRAGLGVPMITTELLSTSDPMARLILSTAGRLSVPLLKPGYYHYRFVDVRRELKEAGEQFRSLTQLAQQNGVHVGYHNHSGYIGAPIWDMAQVIESLDPKWVGYYFDVRHAVVEGGDAGWKIATNLVSPRLKMIAVKDFYWQKTNKGWQQRNCPLGEGMVDWTGYFKALARAGFQGPISLHLEYDIPGSGAALEENTLAAAKRDLEFVKARLQEAYS